MSPAKPAASTIDYEKGRKHWAFQPVQARELPAVKDAAWPRNDVDFFHACADGARERPAIRRATYDLTGLPPTAEEVEAFVADTVPAAFARVVDRLLAEPQYGERWGRHWLDVTRYADTCGNASDFPVPQTFKYRNYVIAEFNADLPFDRFVRAQIAGDLLPAASEEDRMAEHAPLAKNVDQPTAALLTDPKQRGMLEETLVVWATEFGRTPFNTAKDAAGREHHAQAFTCWLAGGGVKGGFSFGETDEFANSIVDEAVHFHDLHATILHVLGLDHTRLTYRNAGRDFRLTDVHGKVVNALLA